MMRLMCTQGLVMCFYWPLIRRFGEDVYMYIYIKFGLGYFLLKKFIVVLENPGFASGGSVIANA